MNEAVASEHKPVVVVECGKTREKNAQCNQKSCLSIACLIYRF